MYLFYTLIDIISNLITLWEDYLKLYLGQTSLMIIEIVNTYVLTPNLSSTVSQNHLKIQWVSDVQNSQRVSYRCAFYPMKPKSQGTTVLKTTFLERENVLSIAAEFLSHVFSLVSNMIE